MPYSQIIGRLVVEVTDQDRIVEAIQKLFDGFVLEGIAVFDSEVTCISVSEVENAAQVRKEMKKGIQEGS